MAHSLYPAGEELGFDQHYRREGSLSVYCSVQSDSQRAIMDRATSCMSPVSGLDPKNRPPPRRRIQVACNRCRKRKIKCSGDSGDGLGCSNCQSAGNTNCQFLRVNSSMLQAKVNGWPYPTVNPALSQSPRLGVYTSHMPSRQTISSMNPRIPSLSRLSSYDVGFVDSQNTYNRQPFGLDHSVNYEEDSASFNAQSSGYVLPSTPQGVLGEYSALPWNSKPWNSPNINDSKAQNGGFFSDQDAESTLAQPAYSYMLHGQGVPSTEVTPVVPTMSLPSDGQASERILPTPGNRNSQLPSNMPVVPTASESMSTEFSQDFRIGTSWVPRPVPASVRAAAQPIPNGVFSASSADRRKPNMPTVQDLGFEYLPITTADTNPPITSGGTVTGLDAVNNGEPQLTSSSAHDNKRPVGMPDCSPDIYGYSTSEKSKNRADEPATLMSGMPYTRVKHPDSGAFAFNLLPLDAIPEYRPPTEARRTSISPLGNPGGF